MATRGSVRVIARKWSAHRPNSVERYIGNGMRYETIAVHDACIKVNVTTSTAANPFRIETDS